MALHETLNGRTEAWLQDIIEFLPDATFVIDAQRKVVIWNRAMEALSGVKAHDILGKGDHEYAIPFYKKRCSLLIDLVFDPDEKSDEHYISLKKEHDHLIARSFIPDFRPGGIHLWKIAKPLYDSEGRIIAAIESIRDITEQRRAEEALQESEEKYRTLFETMVQGVVCHDHEGRIIDANAAAQKIFSMSLEQMSNRDSLDPCWKNIREDGTVFPGELHPAMVALRTGKEVKDVTMGVFNPQCRKISWVNINAVPQCRPGEEKPYQVYTTLEDITEKKILHEKMQQAQKLESLGLLAGGIAHDFNNLLMVMLGNIELAISDMPVNARAAKKLKTAATTCMKASDLCTQMLAYAGKGRLVAEEIDINEIIMEMESIISASVSKKVKLHYALRTELPYVKADATQMRQIVLNLLINASEAIGDNVGTVTVTTGTMEVEDSWKSEMRLGDNLSRGPHVFLEIVDTGCGMDNVLRVKIFDPFFSTKFTGRGLGLAAVLGIVRGHKGAIRLNSEKGRGTSFRVIFPALRECVKVDKHTSMARAESFWKGKGTILLVDDESGVRDVGYAILTHLGFNVLLAEDGLKAAQIYEQKHDVIDCVILDLTMPRMDGIEALDELHRIRSDVPVIISSGYNEQAIKETFKERIISGFIQKPYRLTSMGKKIKEVLADMKDQPFPGNACK